MQVKKAMNMTEKILANHSDNASVTPGDNIWTKVDKLMTHDVCGPGTFGIFQKEFGDKAQVSPGRSKGLVWHPLGRSSTEVPWVKLLDCHTNEHIRISCGVATLSACGVATLSACPVGTHIAVEIVADCVRAQNKYYIKHHAVQQQGSEVLNGDLSAPVA